MNSLNECIDTTYGKRGMRRKMAFEAGYLVFKLGAKIRVARMAKGLTQEQLAKKVGTTKSYISRVESNATEIRLSTLQKIVHKGLDGNLRVTIEL